MDTSSILIDLLVVLVAAKAAAEVSERIGVPAVVGEILAGLLVGPSILGWVGHEDEVLHVLGEIGVILLLLDVGLEMDLGELRKVGGASLGVATMGVVAPMVTGYVAMLAMGESSNTALFVGAALTATSVGITARVFGDLRALATTEARIVLGAAVADDVMGLVVLTVVVRLVTEGGVSMLSLAEIIGVALLFLVVGAAAGLRFTPPLFKWISKVGRGGGTLVALAFAFTLAFAEVAVQAKLAAIIGAFVAGIALGKTEESERIRSDLSPIGHVLIPIFFVQIGINAEISAFGKLGVLTDAAILLVIAIIGKVIAAWGKGRAPGDLLLIGFGMIPRGEVGLIFATIGLQNGVLGEDLYAAVLLVVLATTLITPPLLKQRTRTVMERARAAVRSGVGGAFVEPIPQVVDGEVRLPGRVEDDQALELALRAAIEARFAPVSSDLVNWLAGLPEGAGTGWSRDERELLYDVIERGTPRSWRFLESTGLLARALPELDGALGRRRADPLVLDLDAPYRFEALERLRRLTPGDPAVQQARQLEHPLRMLVGALLAEAFDQDADPVGSARSFAQRIGMAPADVAGVAALVEDRHLLRAAARRTGALSEEHVQQLAGHLADAERARAAYVFALLSSDDYERWEDRRLAELHDLIQGALARAGDEDRDLVAARRTALVEAVGDDDRAVARALAASPAYLLSVPTDDAARQVRALDPLPPRRRFRVHIDQVDDSRWSIDLIGRDRAGLLASASSVLADEDLDVDQATLASWGDGGVVESFQVTGAKAPSADVLQSLVERALEHVTEAGPLADLRLDFDDRASPWHTVCEIEAVERPGLLAEVAAVFRAAGVAVKSATVTSHDGTAYDTFELTTLDGRKLGGGEVEAIRSLAASGVVVQRGRFRTKVVAASA
ncbi:MAG: cation:proton antiporter [Acidimicrobiales bacterium]|nr:cation:proton antiporter [Acidimicrobiales bacterium]